MKQKDLFILIGIGLIAAIISAVVSGKIFTSPSSRSTKVPVVAPISSIFPDVKNDSQYNSFFNANGLDPTQLIKIGPSQNPQPFSNSSQ